MVLCGFVVSLQHTATALEGQSLCQLLEEIKNKAGEIGDFSQESETAVATIHEIIEASSISKGLVFECLD